MREKRKMINNIGKNLLTEAKNGCKIKLGVVFFPAEGGKK